MFASAHTEHEGSETTKSELSIFIQESKLAELDYVFLISITFLINIFAFEPFPTVFFVFPKLSTQRDCLYRSVQALKEILKHQHRDLCTSS